MRRLNPHTQHLTIALLEGAQLSPVLLRNESKSIEEYNWTNIVRLIEIKKSVEPALNVMIRAVKDGIEFGHGAGSLFAIDNAQFAISQLDAEWIGVRYKDEDWVKNRSEIFDNFKKELSKKIPGFVSLYVKLKDRMIDSKKIKELMSDSKKEKDFMNVPFYVELMRLFRQLAKQESVFGDTAKELNAAFDRVDQEKQRQKALEVSAANAAAPAAVEVPTDRTILTSLN